MHIGVKHDSHKLVCFYQIHVGHICCQMIKLTVSFVDFVL